MLNIEEKFFNIKVQVQAEGGLSTLRLEPGLCFLVPPPKPEIGPYILKPKIGLFTLRPKIGLDFFGPIKKHSHPSYFLYNFFFHENDNLMM